jgi:cytochrome o ubiquinol oxidase subunit 1
MWVFAIIGLFGMVATFILRTYNRDVDYYVPAAQVARIEKERYALTRKAA